MGKIFNLDNGVFGDSIFKKDEKVKSASASSSEQELHNYQKSIEHLCGFYDLVNFISKKLYSASEIKIEENIIYLDPIASRDFYMGSGENIHTYQYEIKKEKRVPVKVNHNPFLTCKYDFIHFISWESAYIYENYLYLMAGNQQINSKYYKNMKYFGLAIYCDNISKFDIFNNYSMLDLRKIKFDVYADEDDEENEIQYAKMFVEDKYVEKSLRFMILDDDNRHLIHTHSRKEFEEKHEQYANFIKQKSDNIGNSFGKYNTQFGNLFEYYDIPTHNQTQRNYELEEEKWEAEWENRQQSEKEK